MIGRSPFAELFLIVAIVMVLAIVLGSIIGIGT
jgi:hypothetical protein